MKVFAYACRDFDEGPYFEKHASQLGIDLKMSSKVLKKDTVELAEGCHYISTVASKLDSTILDGLKDIGIRLVSTRSIGYEKIDCNYAEKIGIHVSNVSYGPESVAEYTLMLILAVLRKVKAINRRLEQNNLSLKGVCGERLVDKTVGVIGTGSIGTAVVKMLSALGCRVYVNNRHQMDINGARYLPLDDLLRVCDIITLHVPMSEENFHMIGRDAFERMKDGAIIINTARGGLIDSDALIDGLNSGHIGGCALDVAEDDFVSTPGSRMDIMKSMDNVIVMPHKAFYTESAVSEMIYNSLLSCKLEEEGKVNPWRIV